MSIRHIRLKRFSSKLSNSLNDQNSESKKFNRFKKFFKKQSKFLAKHQKVMKITLLALGIGTILYTQTETRQFLVSCLTRLKAAVFSSSNEENSQLIEKTKSNFNQGSWQTKTRKLLVFFGTMLAYFIYSKYRSEASIDIDVSIEETPTRGWFPSLFSEEFLKWFRTNKELIRLFSAFITVLGLVVPVPGPVGEPMTLLDDVVLFLKRAFQLVGYTGATMQD